MNLVNKYTRNSDFKIDETMKRSKPTCLIAEWILCLERFKWTEKVLTPKKIWIRERNSEIEQSREQLNHLKRKFSELSQVIDTLTEDKDKISKQ